MNSGTTTGLIDYVIEHIGVIIVPWIFGCMIEPPADREYAVDPEEVLMTIPSPRSLRKNYSSRWISNRAIPDFPLSITISLNA